MHHDRRLQKGSDEHLRIHGRIEHSSHIGGLPQCMIVHRLNSLNGHHRDLRTAELGITVSYAGVDIFHY